jgi:hypothetical protein
MISQAAGWHVRSQPHGKWEAGLNKFVSASSMLVFQTESTAASRPDHYPAIPRRIQDGGLMESRRNPQADCGLSQHRPIHNPSPLPTHPSSNDKVVNAFRQSVSSGSMTPPPRERFEDPAAR